VTDLELVGSAAAPDGAAVTDRALLDRAVDGDASAFGELFARHSATVHTYCFRRLGTWSAAEDATSVVFLEVWRRRDSVPETIAPEVGGSLLPWLYGVANNVVRNHARSMRRHRAALERLPQSLREPDPADGVAERIDAERRMQEVLVHLSGLNRVEQEVVALCVWSELSYEQAAVALGVSVATVRSRLARARAHLREAARTHHPEGEPS
jgi:RNA polymerase sigma-70 factor (ECF subfamily)